MTSSGRESWASSPAARATMRGNRGRDTAPELAVRRLVHAAGLRYRVDARPLPSVNRRADLVFRPARVAVFIDGCYWHGCPDHGTQPRTNAQYWSEKITRNVARDRDTDHALAEAGWIALRFWEHDDPQQASATIVQVVEARRTRSGSAHPADSRIASATP